MGSCCGTDGSTNNETKTEQSIASTKSQSTTQSIGLSDGGDKNTKEKHSRRNTSTKGMTRLTMKFPHIRYSFKECKKVFNSHCVNQDDNNDGSGYITKAQVRPLLVELGATSSQLTDEEIDRIVTTSNLDGDDKIDFKEFLIAAAIGCFLNESIYNEQTQSNEFKKIRKGFLVAKEAFDYIDDDKSGEIDFEELKKAFSAMKHDDLILERLKELDFNGDKSIEFPEFVWGITAWVGMDPDGDDDIDEDDFDDENTEMNTGDVKSPKHRLSVDDATNPNNPTFEEDEQ